MVEKGRVERVRIGCFVVELACSFTCEESTSAEVHNDQLENLCSALRRVLSTKAFQDMAGVPDEMQVGCGCSGS